MKHFALALAVAVAITPQVSAQNASHVKPLVPLRLQIVFEKFKGDKRFTSEPFELSLNATGVSPMNPLVPRISRIVPSGNGRHSSGQPEAQYTTATDPVSGETLKVTISLSVVK